MVEAYLDESGIHENAKACVVAGFYGSQAAWRKFEKQWQAVISDYPELHKQGFHAKVFYGRTEKRERLGPFQGWSYDKWRKLQDRLVEVIHRNRIFPIAHATVVADFLALKLETRQWLTGAQFSTDGAVAVTSGCPNKPYYVPFSFCIADSALISGANDMDKVHLFAGLDRTFHKYASTLYKFILEDSRIASSIKSKLGQLSFPLAKDTPGIQAADLLAYRFYQLTKARIKEEKNLPLTPLLEKLLKNRKPNQRFLMFDSVRFQQLEQQARKIHDELTAKGAITKYINGLRNS